jgi:hypothetical protein
MTGKSELKKMTDENEYTGAEHTGLRQYLALLGYAGCTCRYRWRGAWVRVGAEPGCEVWHSGSEL